MITTLAEYRQVQAKGIEPLFGNNLNMPLRKEIQKSLFGEGNHATNNGKFYKWVWQHRPHICEECMKPIRTYSATHISHILTRGAHPEMAYDPRNVNILCKTHHDMWEDATRRFGMRILERNNETIDRLKKDYRL